MILILSEESDTSTSNVIDWISFLNHKFKRENSDHLIGGKYHLEINKDNFSFNQNLEENVGVIWYRRGFGIRSKKKPAFKTLDNKQQRAINKSLFREKNILVESLCRVMQTEWLSNPIKIETIKKIETLKVAQELGIDIPNSLITSSKSKLLEFYYKNEEIIVKSIDEVVGVFDGHDFISQYTSIVPLSYIQNLDSIFFPSLFQERLKKEFEIRAFYLAGNFYSMAIFSQNNKRTEVDFRIYNNEKPNRLIPTKLPLTIEKKIDELMQKLELKTGSIDIVKTIDNRYVFLEVNPIGQFGMVSSPCNYYIEKEIANYLIKKDK